MATSPLGVLMHYLRSLGFLLILVAVRPTITTAQNPGDWLSSLPTPRGYVQKRSSSYDRTGGNADYRVVTPGEAVTLLDAEGSGVVTHLWITIPAMKCFISKGWCCAPSGT